jgi:hypothetical protein
MGLIILLFVVVVSVFLFTRLLKVIREDIEKKHEEIRKMIKGMYK